MSLSQRLALLSALCLFFTPFASAKYLPKTKQSPAPSSLRQAKARFRRDLPLKLSLQPKGELIFPLQPLHAHGSCIVECPNGDLLASWYIGSGERTADDVKVMGARLKKGSNRWSEPFLMADTPDFPDCNSCMVIDPRK